MSERAPATGSDAGRSDAAQAENQSGEIRVRGAQDDCGTGLRSDQTGARIPPVSAAWNRQSARRMVTLVSHPQHSQVPPPLRSVNRREECDSKLPDGNPNGISTAIRPRWPSQVVS